MIEVAIAVSIAALALSCIAIGLLIPVIGKVFFSTHKRELIPLEQFTKVHKDLKKANGIPDADSVVPSENESLKSLWGNQDVMPLTAISSLFGQKGRPEAKKRELEDEL